MDYSRKRWIDDLLPSSEPGWSFAPWLHPAPAPPSSATTNTDTPGPEAIGEGETKELIKAVKRMKQWRR